MSQLIPAPSETSSKEKSYKSLRKGDSQVWFFFFFFGVFFVFFFFFFFLVILGICIWYFPFLRSWTFMRKRSSEVTFFPFIHPFVLRTSFFLVNYNCDVSYDLLWCPNGLEVDRKWNRPWTRSAHPSVCPSVRKWTGSVCPSIPNTSLTSLTNLMRGI